MNPHHHLNQLGVEVVVNQVEVVLLRVGLMILHLPIRHHRVTIHLRTIQVLRLTTLVHQVRSTKYTMPLPMDGGSPSKLAIVGSNPSRGAK